MKRPISLLCLADIHYDESGDMSEVDSLCNELGEYTNEDNQKARWKPDYIVIAGDVANKNNGYKGANGFVESLLNKFGIEPQNVIVVPGNHDKDVSDCSKKSMSSQKSTFNLYCEELCKTEFGDVFFQRFKCFVDFNKRFIEDNDNSCFYKQDSILDNRLCGLSGVKIFEKDHLCFLYVNTEWLYLSGKDKVLVLSNHAEDITDCINIDEACRLCVPLIKDACDKIKRDYPDYTVVTIMHRGFEHFPWGEKNISDASKIDPIAYIKRASDIIITGHDHVFRPAPPTLIENRVQHFQLGSVGRKKSLVAELSRFAEVIRIDIPNGEIEQLIIQYKNNNTDSDSHWEFKPFNKRYPLYSKYPFWGRGRVQYPDAIIRVPSIRDSDIEKAISGYYGFPLEETLIIHADKSNIEQNETTEKKYIVVYYYYNEYLNCTHSEIIKSQLNRFRDINIKKIVLNEMVVEEVVLEYPTWDD